MSDGVIGRFIDAAERHGAIDRYSAQCLRLYSAAVGENRIHAVPDSRSDSPPSAEETTASYNGRETP